MGIGNSPLVVVLAVVVLMLTFCKDVWAELATILTLTLILNHLGYGGAFAIASLVAFVIFLLGYAFSFARQIINNSLF